VHVRENIGFNAMRILRDHDLDPATVALQEVIPMDAQLTAIGLAEYATFRERHRLISGVGVVFGEYAGQGYDADLLGSFDPIIIKPWVPWVWLGGSGASLLFGGWLSRRLWRARL
jgi:hypothetical protein